MFSNQKKKKQTNTEIESTLSVDGDNEQKSDSQLRRSDTFCYLILLIGHARRSYQEMYLGVNCLRITTHRNESENEECAEMELGLFTTHR